MSGIRIGYVLLKNQKVANAPVVVHFHGSGETAADYRLPALAEKYRDLPVHLLAVDYRGYGWSSGEPSLATFLKDAEPFAERLPELFIQHGFAWPYPGGLILSGRSLGAQVAVHVAAMFPTLFRALVLDSALASSATGDRLGKAAERAEAMARWRKELEGASLEILQPLDSEFWVLSVLDKIRAFSGQLLVMHGLEDEMVPYEGSESLHAAAASREKELLLVKGAGHNDIGRHEEYWAALKRFASKVQLESALPSVGPAVEHLCAVCAQKAASKCGRCQKVWYCGRAHQAEHWKLHKTTCSGPQAVPKVVAEADAKLIGVIAMELQDDSKPCLSDCLAAVAQQDSPLSGIFLSFHCSSEEVKSEVSSQLATFRGKYKDLELLVVESSKRLSRFEHIKAALALVPQELAASALVTILDPQGLYSPRYATHLLPTLRRAAADSRAVAVRCPRYAMSKSVPALQVSTQKEVEDHLSNGSAQIHKEDVAEVAEDFVVRHKALQAFLDCTPVSALRHYMCDHRFVHKTANTFGKKVLELPPLPEGEWMRWVTSRNIQNQDKLLEVSACDRRIGSQLVGGSSAPSSDGSEASLPSKLSSEEEASTFIASLRQSIEKRLILRAGEEISTQDLRELSMDILTSGLEEVGLDQVIGIQRWAKETSTELSEVAAQQFDVTIV
eukprot:TRINITY_DN28279_c0_g1_i1.p1 TRINITY_DN28279_c0_g1~~TRINITY_DN28279_c0_g1_i1.p1  ORF type:complete len:765 (-),score=163.61 TRINITY_DN28279_c0_g1_i1:288-2303(-)